MSATLEGGAVTAVVVAAGIDGSRWIVTAQRAARYDELCAAFRAVPAVCIALYGWVRVTDAAESAAAFFSS